MVKPISKPYSLCGDLSDDYRFEAAAIPAGLSHREAPWECDDRSVDVVNTSGSLWVRVFCDEQDTPIAVATFAADDEVVRCDTIDVNVEHRCRGIANALYHLAACLFEAPVVPSGNLLDGGEAFWRGRTSIVC